jgi:hypothetical protein
MVAEAGAVSGGGLRSPQAWPLRGGIQMVFTTEDCFQPEWGSNSKRRLLWRGDTSSDVCLHRSEYPGAILKPISVYQSKIGFVIPKLFIKAVHHFKHVTRHRFGQPFKLMKVERS